MCRLFATTILLIGLILLSLTASAQDQTEKKKGAAFAELLKGDADSFIKRFDKNKDGFLTKDELPPRLMDFFDEADTNGDGKLDKKEVEQLLQMLRKRFGQAPAAKPDNKAEIEQLVDRILAQMDANKDGKISREEAMGPIAENFDELDTNKDGFLDRSELRKFAERVVSRRQLPPEKGKAQVPQPALEIPDFDALDRNADGRLTREELKGTRYADLFDKIDSNKDGKITRKEWETYFKKEAEKKKP